MADDYTPSEARVCIDYCNAAVARREADPVIGMAEADAEFDRFIEAVKRDAAREALDGLARDCEQIAENVMTEAARNRWEHTAHVIRETLAIEHPEETP